MRAVPSLVCARRERGARALWAPRRVTRAITSASSDVSTVSVRLVLHVSVGRLHSTALPGATLSTTTGSRVASSRVAVSSVLVLDFGGLGFGPPPLQGLVVWVVVAWAGSLVLPA